ncbi:MAG: D-glycero-beta-D-manno-heptose-7-phosphate kinase [Verrucomicrobia bacterium]|nr:D-glycero-beta-D-manno-heptose-7-phosphate kinase [Verrucomicrobiota bacterium]
MEHLSRTRAKRILSAFPRTRVLVVGDLMLDEFIWGEVSRISPEAPIPVVEVRSRSTMPGGAANVANNLCALGARASVAGLIGVDAAGRHLRAQLDREGADTSLIVASAGVKTSVKTRVIAHKQHVVRVDDERPLGDGQRLRSRLVAKVRAARRVFGAIVIEDYGKGVLSQELVDEVVAYARQRAIPIIVDPKKEHPLRLDGVDLVTPNREEANMLAGVPLHSDVPPEEVGRMLSEMWGGAAVLVTLGADGMCLIEKNLQPRHIPTRKIEVYDVAGAGDTVCAVMALGLANKLPLAEAAALANLAAGVVVGKVGTGTVTRAELLHALEAV